MFVGWLCCLGCVDLCSVCYLAIVACFVLWYTEWILGLLWDGGFPLFVLLFVVCLT